MTPAQPVTTFWRLAGMSYLQVSRNENGGMKLAASPAKSDLPMLSSCGGPICHSGSLCFVGRISFGFETNCKMYRLVFSS